RSAAETLAMDDPYQVLGLNRSCEASEIRRRYLTLVRQHPPERDPEQFAAIRSAYDELRDPVERLNKDLFRIATRDSLDDAIAEVRQQLRDTRLPVDVLLSLADRT
ncbi:MAG: J domain-containing protein, partial [Pirellulales bacterium]